mmetsp:Transcript_12710/g.43027  ORF Transcript_12710/g.43027 Transcript_12710/m.43027 type:complete len:206 (-) Transcript_12710:50-667(-)
MHSPRRPESTRPCAARCSTVGGGGGGLGGAGGGSGGGATGALPRREGRPSSSSASCQRTAAIAASLSHSPWLTAGPERGPLQEASPAGRRAGSGLRAARGGASASASTTDQAVEAVDEVSSETTLHESLSLPLALHGAAGSQTVPSARPQAIEGAGSGSLCGQTKQSSSRSWATSSKRSASSRSWWRPSSRQVRRRAARMFLHPV